MAAGWDEEDELGEVMEDLWPGERISPMDPGELLASGEYRPVVETPGLRCKTCRHPQVDVIDRHLIEQDLTLEEISKVYGISESALSRHKRDCIVGMVLKGRALAQQQKIARKLVKTLDKVDQLYDVGMGLLKQSAEGQNVGDSLALMTKLEDNLRLRGELAGELVGPNGPSPSQQMATGNPGQGGKVQVIVLPTTFGRPPEDIAKLIEAKPLLLDDGEDSEDDGSGE